MARHKIDLADLDNYEVKHEIASSFGGRNDGKALYSCIRIRASKKTEGYFMVLNKRTKTERFYDLLEDAIFTYNII